MDKRNTITKDGTLINVKIIANASQNSLEAEDEYYKIRIKAPAVDGKANKELCTFLSDYFKLPKSSIVILKGEKSSRKTILLKGFKIVQANLPSF